MENKRNKGRSSAGYRRPPRAKPRKTRGMDLFAMIIKAMLDQIPWASSFTPSKHSGSITHSAFQKAVEKRRARNKMARRSRRINRLYA